MPFYPNLRVKKNDPDLLKKKRTATNLKSLQAALRKHIKDSQESEVTGETVKIATWNLREYGAPKFGGRDFEANYYIAEIISHFDIVALQEVRANLREFKRLCRYLGPDWSYVATDVTDGHAGNGERMIFLYNERKVLFRHIAGELTLKESGKIRASFGERLKLESGLVLTTPAGSPSLSGTYRARLKTSSGKKKLNADLEIPLPAGSTLEIPDGSSLVVTKNTEVVSPGKGKATVEIPDEISGSEYRLRFPADTFDDSLRQFARTPFLISFQSGWLKLNLCTVHIYYGDATDALKLEQRRSEIEQLTKALASKAKGEFKDDDTSFLGVLGDFNIVGEGHATMEALESNDFVIPNKLKSIPGSNVARDRAYDQIAFWEPSKRATRYASLDFKGANIFDFFEHVFTMDDEAIYRGEDDNGLKPTSSYKTWRTYKMSDHLPMWIELRTDFSDEYLKAIEDS